MFTGFLLITVNWKDPKEWENVINLLIATYLLVCVNTNESSINLKN